MSQALYDELMELQKKKQEEWETHHAPPVFLLEGFFAAFRILLESHAISLDVEFAECLLKKAENLRASYRRAQERSIPDDVHLMEAALKNHIETHRSRISGNGFHPKKAEPDAKD